jgi:hypothetical protein
MNFRTTAATLVLATLASIASAQGVWPDDPWTDFRSLRPTSEILRPGRAVDFAVYLDMYASGYDANGNGVVGKYVYGNGATVLEEVIADPADQPTRGFGMKLVSFISILVVADPGYTTDTPPVDFDGLPVPPSAPGRVEVFRRRPFTSPNQHIDTLENPTGNEQSGFGLALDMFDRYILVGAPFATVLGVENAGLAFVYEWNGDHFSPEYDLVATLLPPTLIPDGYFGYAVAQDDLGIAIGWPGFDDNRGRVVMYTEEDSDLWKPSRTIDPNDLPIPNDSDLQWFRWFGASLASLDQGEGFLAIGAPHSSLRSSQQRGAVVVLGKPWFEDPPYKYEAIFLPPPASTEAGMYFGDGLAVSSGTGYNRLLAIGSSNRNTEPGTVHVYESPKSDAEWSHTAELPRANGGSIAAVSAYPDIYRVLASGNTTNNDRGYVYSREVICMPDLRGDANNDGVTNFEDLNLVLVNFGRVGEDLPGDLNDDNRVNNTDLNIVLAYFGSPCLPPN